MDYKYIREYQHNISESCVDFINKLERMCEAYDISIYNDNNVFKSVDEVFKDITMASLKHYSGIVYENN